MNQDHTPNRCDKVNDKIIRNRDFTMNRFNIALAIALTLIASTTNAAKPGEGTEPSTYKYIGISDYPVEGTSGLTVHTEACRSIYGEQARMATSKEIIEFAVFPNQLTAIWVRPIITHAIHNGAHVEYTDYSGVSAQKSMTCLMTGSTTTGLTYNLSLGRFKTFDCTTSLPVACSAPQ